MYINLILCRIRTIKKEIRKKEQTSKTKSLKREALKRKHELYSTKRLGKHVYPILNYLHVFVKHHSDS